MNCEGKKKTKSNNKRRRINMNIKEERLKRILKKMKK